MNQLQTVAPVVVLEERLARGAELLFDMEQRGEMGSDYQRWLDHWQHLLFEYESFHVAT